MLIKHIRYQTIFCGDKIHHVKRLFSMHFWVQQGEAHKESHKQVSFAHGLVQRSRLG
jgi:hypothetical protein